MEAAGLVRRSPSTVDRRAVVVSLTAKGERLRQPLRELWQELERTTTSAVAPGALEDLVGSLHAVRRAVVERAGQAVESDVHARQAAADSDG
jgi:DNA-binding MarR family transcriptional regulator